MGNIQSILVGSSRKPVAFHGLEENGGGESMVRDSNHLLQIFPEEIWRLIAERIREPDDLENLMNASPFFRNLLLDKRVLFLFPKVWNILVAQYHKRHLTDRSFNEALHDAMIGIKWYSGILRLRLVCQTWRNVIDQLFQKQASNFQWSDEPMSSDKRIGGWINYSISFRNTNLQDFHQHFDASHGAIKDVDMKRNPFLNRKLSILFGFGGNIEPVEFFRQIIHFLRTYGEHVWCCRIKIRNLPLLSLVYSLLLRFLSLMPNLKVVSIDHPPIPPLQQDYLEQLQLLIGLDRLPTLESLKFLVAKGMHMLILNEFIRSNGHVTMLEVQNCGSHLQDCAIYSRPMPNLNQLALEFYEEADIQYLESSPHVNWPLQKLYLSFNLCHHIDIRRIFALLEDKWSTTLTELILNFHPLDPKGSRILEDCKSGTLNLPNLRRLELLMPGVFTLDFILPMRESLEILDVTIVSTNPFNGRRNKSLFYETERNQQIKLFSFTGRPLESNVWTIFPKLKQVTLNKAALSVAVRFPRSSKLKVQLWSHSRRQWMQAKELHSFCMIS